VAEGTLFHESKKYGHENQDVNGRSDHAAHDRSCDRLHHVGTDARFPQDGDEAGEDRRDGHKFRTQTLGRYREGAAVEGRRILPSVDQMAVPRVHDFDGQNQNRCCSWCEAGLEGAFFTSGNGASVKEQHDAVRAVNAGAEGVPIAIRSH